MIHFFHIEISSVIILFHIEISEAISFSSSIFSPKNPPFFSGLFGKAMISVAELAGTEREAIGPGFSTKDLGTKIEAVPKSKGKTLIDRAHHLEALRLLLKLGLEVFFGGKKQKTTTNLGGFTQS